MGTMLINDSPFTVGWLVGHVPPHELSLSVCVKATLTLVPGGTATPVELQDPLLGDETEVRDDGDGEATGLRYAADIVPFKPRADILAAAVAHVPGGKTASALDVSFGVGEWSKALVIGGNRTVQKGLIGSSVGAPEPFSSMPVIWANTFGGATYADNPDGKGTGDPSDGERSHMFPNVIRATSPTEGSRMMLNEPASYAPVSTFWPQRASLPQRATWDNEWLRTRWPGYPADFDFGYFNAAPPDQQTDYLAGNETIRLYNLDPDVPELSCTLPGTRVRWFIADSPDGASRFREVDLVIDTLFVDTARRTVNVTWRGVTDIASKRMSDVRAHWIVTEPAGEEKPVSEYEAALEPKIEAEAAPPEPEPIEEIQPVGELEDPTAEMDFDKWEEGLEKSIADAEAHIAGQTAALQADFAEHAAQMQVNGVDPMPLMEQTTGPTAIEDLGPRVADMRERLLPRMPKELDEVMQFEPPDPADMAAQAEKEIDDVSAALDAELGEAFKDFEMSPEPEDPAADEADEAGGDWTRESALEHAGNGGHFDGEDLSGLDLTEGAFIGTTFRGATLAGTIFAMADLTGADFTDAMLEEASFDGARMSTAVLDNADCTSASFVGAELDGVSLVDGDCSLATFEDAVLDNLAASGATFAGARLAGCSLKNGTFTYADFDEADLQNVVAEGSDLSNASAYAAKAAGIDLRGTTLIAFRTGDAGDFSDANLRGVDATGSVWEDSVLDRTDLCETQLVDANFDGASLIEAKLIMADGREARFFEANLTRADCTAANLFRALLEGADLTGAKIEGANLYEAELLDAAMAGTSFTVSNVKETKLA